MRIIYQKTVDCLHFPLSFCLLILLGALSASQTAAQNYPIALEKNTVLSPRNADSYNAMARQYAKAACISYVAEAKDGNKKGGGGKTLTDENCIYNPEEATRLRNNLVYIALAQSDAVFSEHRSNRRKWTAIFEIFMTFLESGLTAATGITNGEREKSILADVSGLIQGTHRSVQKNLRLAENGVLFNVMEKERAKVKTELMDRMKQDDSGYSFLMALMDVMRYNRAGTLDQAMASLAASTGQEKDEEIANAKRANDAMLKSGSFVDYEISAKATDKLKTLGRQSRSVSGGKTFTLNAKLTSLINNIEKDEVLKEEIGNYSVLFRLFRSMKSCGGSNAESCDDNSFLQQLSEFRRQANILLDDSSMRKLNRIIADLNP